MTIPKINVALDDHQEKYQPTMVDFEGKIFDQAIFVLIYPGATLSYVSPKIVDKCCLQGVKYKNPGSVQLATGPRRQVLAKVSSYPLVIASQSVITYLNIFPLGSYDVLIGINWL